MSERPSDRWISTAWSVVLHAVIIGLLAYGWMLFKEKPRPEVATPAIDAMVVDSRSLGAIPPTPRPRPQPEPPPPEPEPVPEPTPQEPPQPTPEELAQREQDQREQEQQREVEQKRQADELRIAEEQKVAEEKRIADERAESERKTREEAERKAAEAKRKAEEQKLAEQKRIEDEKRKADARLAAERESELRKSLEEEERVMAARSSGAMANWIAQIQARIQRAWIRPPSARQGLDCTLLVTQVPGGEIVNVRVASCNGDQAVRESIEAAAFRASPLPPPPDPALFERNLEIRFRPVD